MAKKNFAAGMTKTGVLNNMGGEKLKEMQAKTEYNFQYIPKEKNTARTVLMLSWKVF